MDAVAIKPVDSASLCSTQVQRLGRDGLEDRLNVGLSAADDTEDLAGCRLLLQRLAQLCVGFRQLARARFDKWRWSD
jgi:hypothetical protein